MAATVDADVPETGAVFTFGRSKFADNLPNKFWVKNDRVLQIACGDEHTALIAESGRVFMFGPNEWGQLGLGNDNKGVNKPSCVKSLKQEKSKYVACGRSHTIVSTEAGHIYSFGSHADGQLGYKTSTDQHVPKRIESLPSTKYKMLAAGSDSSVALTDDGRVFMWGNNEDGKLGLGEVEIVEEPTQLPMDRPVVCVACGYYHTAIVTDDGKLFTMGESDGGKLGLTDAPGETNVPQHVTAIPEPVRWVSCGSSHTVALTEKGNCYVFGEGESGQLGLGTDINSVTTPTLLKLPFKAIKAYCGQAFTALISEKGQLYTFGDGRHGKLAHGDDQFSNQFKPYHCKRFSHFIVTKVACGGCHMIVTAKPKLHDDFDESMDGEMDEMKTLEDKTLLQTLDGGSPTLSRSLSAREKRRNEVTRSFSTLTDLLPALNRTRLSTTMPALKSSHPKVNGEVLSKTVSSMLAVQNGVGSDKDSDEEDVHKKVAVNKEHTPVASPRRKVENSKALGHEEDGSEGDDEQDDSSAQEEDNGKGDKLSEDEDEDLMALTNELEKKIKDDDSDNEKLADKSGPKSLAKVDSTELHNGRAETNGKEVKEMEEKKEEEKSLHSAAGEVHVDTVQTRKMPLPTPRKKTDSKEKSQDSEEEDEEDDDVDDDVDDDEEDEEEDANKKKESEKKEKEQKKDEKDKDKAKEDKVKDKKDKKKTKDKENKEEENGEQEKKDKKKGKNKEDKSKDNSKAKKGKEKDKDEIEDKESNKDKKKTKDEDKSNKGKKKGKKEAENEEKDEKDEKEQNDKKKDKNKKKEETDAKKKKKGEKGKEDEEIASDEKTTASEKDENGNKKPPAKKSRLCTIL